MFPCQYHVYKHVLRNTNFKHARGWTHVHEHAAIHKQPRCECVSTQTHYHVTHRNVRTISFEHTCTPSSSVSLQYHVNIYHMCTLTLTCHHIHTKTRDRGSTKTLPRYSKRTVTVNANMCTCHCTQK